MRGKAVERHDLLTTSARGPDGEIVLYLLASSVHCLVQIGIILIGLVHQEGIFLTAPNWEERRFAFADCLDLIAVSWGQPRIIKGSGVNSLWSFSRREERPQRHRRVLFVAE